MKSDSKKLCLICGLESDGGHFGAESCRACAAFFRRTVQLQKVYRCKAFNRCEINSLVRCICRACRLSKCLKVGMQRREVRHQKTPQKSVDTSNSKQEDQDQLVEASTSQIVKKNMPSLESIKLAYAQLESVRKDVHGRDGNDVFSNRSPQALNYKESCEVLSKEIKLGINFLQSAFPELTSLPNEQKKALYNHFFLSFLMLENGYYCAQNDRTDVVFLPSGDYIDYKRPEIFYFDVQNKQNLSTEDAVKIFACSWIVYRRNILEPMRRLKITDVEFYALIAFALWEQGLDGLSEDTEKVGKQIRDKIGKELIFYYNEIVKDIDYAVRLTCTLTLLRTLQRAVRRFQHDVEISNVFNVYAIDNNVYEVTNGKM